MSGNVDFSVVIPVYNGGAFIRTALESVLRQSHAAKEVIVVDDGSTDETPEILKSFGDRILVKRQANAGAACARNAGVELSSSRWVSFLDAGDFWFKDKLAVEAHLIRAYPDIRFFCSDYFARYLHLGGRLLRHYSTLQHPDRILFNAPLQTEPFLLLLRENFIGTTSAVTVERSLFLDAGLFNESYSASEGLDFFLRSSLRTNFIISSRPTVYKRTREAGPKPDEIAIYANHRDILRNALEARREKVKKGGWLGFCVRAAAENNYRLGNSYYENGNIRKAFSSYWEGLLFSWDLGNILAFLWVAGKKGIRLLSFGTLRRKGPSVLPRIWTRV